MPAKFTLMLMGFMCWRLEPMGSIYQFYHPSQNTSMVLIAKRLTIIFEVGMFKQQKANFKSLFVRHLYPIKVGKMIIECTPKCLQQLPVFFVVILNLIIRQMWIFCLVEKNSSTKTKKGQKQMQRNSLIQGHSV